MKKSYFLEKFEFLIKQGAIIVNQRCKSQKIHSLINCAQLSLRKIGKILGFSKSSVGRHKIKIDKRKNVPLADIWETPEGYNWLSRLVVITIYAFGLKKMLVAIG